MDTVHSDPPPVHGHLTCLGCGRRLACPPEDQGRYLYHRAWPRCCGRGVMAFSPDRPPDAPPRGPRPERVRWGLKLP